MLKFTKFIIILLVLSVQAQAQHWSYVYIQGDKETPFYVKLEDEMLPRYSKNYYIIPQLEEGPIHIQILFQQNIYPPQNFTILVPKNGNRSFLLTHKNDAFSLYDIQQKTYISPGEKIDDKIPATNLSTPITNTEAKDVPTKEVTNKDANSNDPNFINNIELNNNHSVTASPKDSTVNTSPQLKEAPSAQENYNIAQEKAVTEMPATPNVQEETPAPQTTLKQQVESDYNKVKEPVPSTQEQTQTTNVEEETITAPTTQEPANNTPQTTPSADKDFSKINPEVVQENKQAATSNEQPLQEAANNVVEKTPTPTVEKDASKVNEVANQELTQTTLPETNTNQVPVQETVTPQVNQPEQTTTVPSSEVIKAEQEYYNAHKANNNQAVENTTPQTNTIEQAPEYNKLPETPAVVNPPATNVNSNTILPPPPPHPTSIYKAEEEIALTSNDRQITNSACPEPVSEKEFDKIYSTDQSKSDGKDRLKFLMKQAEENCFTTRQVYFLTKEITAESMRYSFLKKVYAHVTDQQNFRLLEDNLFKTLEWKSYFRTIQ